MDVCLGDTISPAFFTHDDTGAAANADSTPTVDWRENGAAAATTGVTVSSVTTGEYKAAIVCSSGNGFEAGKYYEVAAIVVVGGVTSKQNIMRFRVIATETTAGTPKVDLNLWRGQQPQALNGSGEFSRSSFAQDVKDMFAELRRNTATAGGASTITLDASASAVDDFYNGALIVLVSGTGSGQFRTVSDYVGATKVLTVDSAWSTNPDNTSVFEIIGATNAQASLGAGSISFSTLASDLQLAHGFVRRNTATAGAATTITLDASASATDDAYNNMTIFVASGTGALQERTVIDYVGSTKVATVDRAWLTNPDATSVFVIRSGAPTIDGISLDTWTTTGEGSASYGDLVRLMVGVLCGKVSNFLTGTLVFKSINGTKTRATVTTDETGRLSLVVGDLT